MRITSIARWIRDCCWESRLLDFYTCCRLVARDSSRRGTSAGRKCRRDAPLWDRRLRRRRACELLDLLGEMLRENTILMS